MVRGNFRVVKSRGDDVTGTFEKPRCLTIPTRSAGIDTGREQVQRSGSNATRERANPEREADGTAGGGGGW